MVPMLYYAQCNGDVWSSGGIGPCILNLHTSYIIPTQRKYWYPLDRKLNGPQSQSGLTGREKSLCATWESTPSSSCCLLTKSTEIHWCLLSADESKEWFNLPGFVRQRRCKKNFASLYEISVLKDAISAVS
jgi:hypothetical protein